MVQPSADASICLPSTSHRRTTSESSNRKAMEKFDVKLVRPHAGKLTRARITTCSYVEHVKDFIHGKKLLRMPPQVSLGLQPLMKAKQKSIPQS